MLGTVSFYLDSFHIFLGQLCFDGFGSGCHCLEAAAASVCDCSAVTLFLDPEGFRHSKALTSYSRAGKVPRSMSWTAKVVCGFFYWLLVVLNVTCVASEDTYSMRTKTGMLFSVKNIRLSNQKLITTK